MKNFEGGEREEKGGRWGRPREASIFEAPPFKMHYAGGWSTIGERRKERGSTKPAAMRKRERRNEIEAAAEGVRWRGTGKKEWRESEREGLRRGEKRFRPSENFHS